MRASLLASAVAKNIVMKPLRGRGKPRPKTVFIQFAGRKSTTRAGLQLDECWVRVFFAPRLLVFDVSPRFLTR
jgi:hypothetical protein